MNLELIAYTEIIRMGGNIMTENWENKKRNGWNQLSSFIMRLKLG